MNMQLKQAQKEDLQQIARLHCSSIRKGFLSSLGVPFLVLLYETILSQRSSIIYVATDNDKVLGFISGTVSTNNLYKKIIFKNWFKFALPLFRYLFSWKVIIRISETLRYGFKREEHKTISSNEAELLSVAVDETCRGKGIGKLLLHELELFFKSSNIQEYKVVTFSEDLRSTGFYCKSGFVLKRQFNHHQNLMNEYIKKVV